MLRIHPARGTNIGLQACLWGGGASRTHNLINIDFGFGNGFPGSTDGERYSIIHKDLMKLCYRGWIRVVYDWVVGVADRRAGVDAGELVDGAHLLHGRTLWMVAFRQSVYRI